MTRWNGIIVTRDVVCIDQVLTSKSCSEEGLEDATNLLLQLSRANSATRDRVLSLLLDGATQLGLTVCSHIRSDSHFFLASVVRFSFYSGS